MIFAEKTVERKKRDRIGYAGALLLFLAAVLSPADVLSTLPFLRPPVDALAAHAPMIDAFAAVSNAPDAARFNLSLLLIATPLFAVPYIRYQLQVQDFARTNPRVRHFGWGMAIFLACPWWLHPGRSNGSRSHLLNALVSAGPVGLGCFTVGLYGLFLLSLTVTAVSFTSFFRKS